MNNLFVGKWDLAGSYIANKLIREGDEVCWICYGETGSLWDDNFKGRKYDQKISQDECSKILKTNSIKRVFFMLPELREKIIDIDTDYCQTYDYASILESLKEYKIERLVCLSSVEVDEESENSPVVTQMKYIESLCSSYSSSYQIPLLTLRLPFVYGDKCINNSGYISKALRYISEEKTVNCPFSLNDYIDAVYGEDVAMAVYNLLKLDKCGIYRILTGHPIKIDDFYRILSNVCRRNAKINYQFYKKSLSYEYYTADNSLKMETGWIPFYLLTEEKGTRKLNKYYKSMHEETAAVKSGFTKIREFAGKPYVKHLLETLMLFVLMEIFLVFSASVNDLKYVDIRLMYVTLICSLNGMATGTVAIILACVSYVLHLALSNVDVSYFLYNIDSWIPFAIYIAGGCLLGYNSDLKKDESDSLKEKYHTLNDKYNFLKGIHHETLEIKKDLQKQIAISKHSFGYVYEVAEKLDTLKPEEIMFNLVNIFENVMDCSKVAIYLIGNNSSYARLKACSSNLKDQASGSLKIDDYPKMIESFKKTNMYINKELLSLYPDMASPIYYDGKILGFIAVFDLGSDKFTVYYQNLYRILTSLIERNLVKALEYENARRKELYYPDSDLMYSTAFKEELKTLDSQKDDVYITYVLVKIEPAYSIERDELIHRIASVIRESDKMGEDDSGNILVILMNMKKENLTVVEKRFENKGLKMEIVRYD